uniref:Uncharacterized protein n=1 Tax=Anguilla anguilla TaxID=7936 RepID=A0A0E9R3X6_ANGAN
MLINSDKAWFALNPLWKCIRMFLDLYRQGTIRS